MEDFRDLTTAELLERSQELHDGCGSEEELEYVSIRKEIGRRQQAIDDRGYQDFLDRYDDI